MQRSMRSDAPGLTLPRDAATFWGPHGHRVVTAILRNLPASVAVLPVHLVLLDPFRSLAVWTGAMKAPPGDPPPRVALPEEAASHLREETGADLLTRIPTLEPMLEGLLGAPPPASLRCFPLRAGRDVPGLFLVAAQGLTRRVAADLRLYARLSATALVVARHSLEEQRELEAYRALSHVLNVGAPRDRHALARALGRSMAAVTHARDCLVLARADASAPLVVIGSRGYLRRDLSSLVVWPHESPWNERLDAGQPFEVDTALLEPGWQSGLGTTRLLMAPIHWKGWLRGLLVFPADDSRSGGAHLVDPARLASVAAHAGLLWQNADLIERLRRDEEVLQGLMQRAIEAQEEERRRLASDIHDGVTQRIVGIWYHIINLEKIVGSALPEAHAEINIIKEHLDAALTDARAAIYNLRPSTLDDLGLVPSLHSLVREFETETGAITAVQVRGERRLPGYVEVGIYRIVQEALRNIKKHAQARSVKVALHLGDEAVRLTVSDDGRGFTRRRPGEGRLKSFGLEAMAERAQMLGAELFVRSRAGEGTTIRVALRASAEGIS